MPASFDAAARELTVQAAERAGLPSVRLLEEPQAAFYSWIETAGERWRKQVKVGDVILVSDIGGGTTDFSLIAVSEEGGELELKRIAVGEHILLGGDNMDLALAYAVQQKLAAKGTKLDAGQMRGLWQNCRVAKENLLQSGATKKQPIAILGRGSSVIGGAIKTDLAYDEVETTLVDGFFPRCEANEMPKTGRRVGLQEMGLPYAADPAVTRHLAKFLTRQKETTSDSQTFAHPTAILFNGGVMKATLLRQRLVDVLNGWLSQEGKLNICECWRAPISTMQLHVALRTMAWHVAVKASVSVAAQRGRITLVSRPRCLPYQGWLLPQGALCRTVRYGRRNRE